MILNLTMTSFHAINIMEPPDRVRDGCINLFITLILRSVEIGEQMPTRSGKFFNLEEIAIKLSQRLIKIFLRDGDGNRPFFGDKGEIMRNPDGRGNILFHEYFHGDSGAGLGASHQTGWTALVAKLIQDCA